MTLAVENVTVKFGGVVAVRDVSLAVKPGEILAVVGANGSGKSTLFNSITGFVKPAAGRVLLDGAEIGKDLPQRRIARGIARTFQTPRFDRQSITEQAVRCGFYTVSKAGLLQTMFRTPLARTEERAFREGARSILQDLGLDDIRHERIGALPMGQVRLVEVARAIANRPKFLLLDEPAAGLTSTEQALLAKEVRKLAASGVGVLLVEHNFGLVRRLSDRVVVLNRGAVLTQGLAADVAREPAFIDAYLGKSGREATP